MKELRTETEITASAAKVWDILTDFEKYEQWNPFIRKIIGVAKEGARIQIHLHTPAGKNRKYEPIVTKVDEGRELRWLGGGFFLNGEHIFLIDEPRPGHVLFVQHEVFTGMMTSFFGRGIHEDITAGLNEMNASLKARAERSAN
ncbi:MAG: SRPBCC family protein [Nitrososphaera sp.]